MQATVLKYLPQQRGLSEERWDWENRSHQPPDTTVAATAAVCKCSLCSFALDHQRMKGIKAVSKHHDCPKISLTQKVGSTNFEYKCLETMVLPT